MSLLESDLEHVLVNSVNALRVLCDGNHDNQTAIANSGAVDTLTELLSEYNPYYVSRFISLVKRSKNNGTRILNPVILVWAVNCQSLDNEIPKFGNF